MQDEIHDKSVALTIKVGKAVGRLTVGLLKWAMLQGADNMPGKWQMPIFRAADHPEYTEKRYCTDERSC